MKYLSSIVGILCGLVLLVVAAVRYFGIRRELADAEGAEVQLFGYALTAESWQFTFAFGAAIVLGVALIGIGAFALMKKIQEG